MRSKNRIFEILAIACIVCACAPQTETIKLYENLSNAQPNYQKLLVIDVSTDRDLQRQFENEIVAGLRREDVEAIAGHTKLAGGELRQAEINRVSDELGADAILITHIASVDTRAGLHEGHEDMISTCRRGDPVDYFLYDHEVLSEPDSVEAAHTVVVITNLYDVSSRERILTIQSTCFEKASMAIVLLEEAKAIVSQLRIEGLI